MSTLGVRSAALQIGLVRVEKEIRRRRSWSPDSRHRIAVAHDPDFVSGSTCLQHDPNLLPVLPRLRRGDENPVGDILNLAWSVSRLTSATAAGACSDFATSPPSCSIGPAKRREFGGFRSLSSCRSSPGRSVASGSAPFRIGQAHAPWVLPTTGVREARLSPPARRRHQVARK